MRRMYSKKQIEEMYAYRTLMIKSSNKTYLTSVLLPKSATDDDLPRILSNDEAASTLFGHLTDDLNALIIEIQYVSGNWFVSSTYDTTQVCTIKIV